MTMNRICDSCYCNADEYDVREKMSLGMIETVKIFVLTLLSHYHLVLLWHGDECPELK